MLLLFQYEMSYNKHAKCLHYSHSCLCYQQNIMGQRMSCLFWLVHILIKTLTNIILVDRFKNIIWDRFRKIAFRIQKQKGAKKSRKNILNRFRFLKDRADEVDLGKYHEIQQIEKWTKNRKRSLRGELRGASSFLLPGLACLYLIYFSKFGI